MKWSSCMIELRSTGGSMWAEPAILDASVEIASEAPETACLSRAKKVALTGGAQFLLLLMRPAFGVCVR